MKVFNTIKQFQNYRNQLHNKSIGFVPTMGALHAGHLSLIDLSIKNNSDTIVSIFVNPTQFDNKNDLDNYPNLLKNDLNLLEKAGVNCVFLPSFEQMYPDGYAFTLQENQLSQKYCGSHRAGHFNGVLTVVMKLLNLVRPTKAYFGEKDYQQMTLIKQMVEAFFIPIDIVAGKTIREVDGLAMSSRNLNLTSEQRKIAPLLYQILSSNLSLKQMQKQLETNGFIVDYLEILENRLLVAAFLGTVRLIDNVEIKLMENAA